MLIGACNPMLSPITGPIQDAHLFIFMDFCERDLQALMQSVGGLPVVLIRRYSNPFTSFGPFRTLFSAPHHPTRAPCDMPCLVPMLIGC